MDASLGNSLEWPDKTEEPRLDTNCLNVMTEVKHNAIDSQTTIGHVHLKVANLNRALAFYNGVLGFEISQRIGDSAAFLSAGGYHHHIGLNTWESKDGTPGT